jgi:hypothetical protein
MKIVQYFFLLLLLSCLIKCGKKCDCNQDHLLLGFLHYSIADVDTIIVKRFAKGSGYSGSFDSTILTAYNSFKIQLGDSLKFEYEDEGFLLKPSNDWLVEIPAVNRTVTFSDLIEEKKQQRCKRKKAATCTNNIVSFKLDGTEVSAGGTGYEIYIKK